MLRRRDLELGTAAVVFVLGALVVAGALDHPIGWMADGPQAGYFPFRLGLILLFASAAIAVQAWRDTVRGGQPVLTREGAARMVWFVVPLVAYVGIAQVLGLYVATGLYLGFMLRAVGRHGWRTVVAVALAVPACGWVLFEWWFTVPLLKGPVEAWLGLA
jgi:uncharacterized membrane protein YhaH (DUF805 family)